MSVYVLRTIDGQSVLARVNAADGILDAAKTASMQTALNMLTAYTDLPYGFYDTFADGASVTLINAIQSIATSPNAIPTMTSNTSPSGVCSASSVYSADFAAWKAADKINSGTDGWGSNAVPTGAAPQWWEFEFASATRIVSMQLRNREQYPNSPASFAVYATNAASPGTDYTASEWTQVLGTTTNANNTGGALLGPWPYVDAREHKKYRIVITARNSTNSNVAIGEVMLYPTSASLITPTSYGGTNAVPAMTSNTAPSGVAFSTTATSGWDAYKAFDQSDSTSWASTAPWSSPQYLGYVFSTAQNVVGYTIKPYTNLNQNPSAWVFQTSVDTTNGTDGTWTDRDSITHTWGDASPVFFPLSSALSGVKGVRLKITATAYGTSGVITAVGLLVHSDRAYNESTIISTAKTVLTAPSHAMGMIWLDAKGATVTDATETNNAIRLYFSRDNGATWDWLPLTDEGVVSGDVRQYTCPEKLLAATSGTNIKLKLTSHDPGSGAPNFELHGWGCVYNVGA